MKKRDFKDVGYTIAGSPFQDSKMILDMSEFRDWLAQEWRLVNWEDWGWKQTRIPRFVFSIDVSVSDGEVKIEGEVDKDDWRTIVFYNGSHKFVAIFMRKLMDRFPGNDGLYTRISGYSYVVLSEDYSLKQIESMDNDDILGRILVDPGLGFMRKLGEL